MQVLSWIPELEWNTAFWPHFDMSEFFFGPLIQLVLNEKKDDIKQFKKNTLQMCQKIHVKNTRLHENNQCWKHQYWIRSNALQVLAPAVSGNTANWC